MKKRNYGSDATNTFQNYQYNQPEIEKGRWLNGTRKAYIITLLVISIFILDFHLPHQKSTEIYEKEYTEYVPSISRSRLSSTIQLLKTDKHIYSTQDVIHKPPYKWRDLTGEVLHVKQTPLLKKRISFESQNLSYQASNVFKYLIYINFGVMFIGLLFFSKGTDNQIGFLGVMIVVTITLLVLDLYS